MAQMAEQFAQQLGPIAEPSLGLCTTPNEQLFWSLSKWARIALPDEECAASKIQRSLLGVVPLLELGWARCNNLSIERILRHAPDH